jgi:hypothetical protein
LIAPAGELFPEQPDRARVGNPIRQAQTQEPHERQPVVDEKFRALVRQIVGGLNDQNLEHQNPIERRPSALGEAMGRAAGVWHHRRWMKVMEVPHAPS